MSDLLDARVVVDRFYSFECEWRELVDWFYGSEKALQAVLQDNGVSLNKGKQSFRDWYDTLVFARELLEDGASYREVTKTTGVSHKYLKQYFPRFGWGTGYSEEAAMTRRANQILQYGKKEHRF